jgi:hypothetical protein
MGVYIKGMTMPKSCFECDLYGDENNFCKAQKEYMPFASFGRDYKDANCPLAEVPEPHGRLIDADEFNEFIEKHCTDSLYDLWKELVRRQQTVIEAEGE